MENFIAIAKERMRHPFLGSFSIGFIIWNWRALLYATTGNAEASERIKNIISVTIGSGEERQWIFLYEPLIFALAIAFIVFPVGELLNHFVLVQVKNYKDAITTRWDVTEELKFRLAQDVCSYTGYVVSQLHGMLGAHHQPAKVQVDTIMPFLNAIKENDERMLKRLWKTIPKEHQS